MIQVAHIFNRIDNGGAENLIADYYRHIDRSKVRFDFFYVKGSTLPKREEMERLGAEFIELPNYSHIFEYQRALKKAFSKKHYDIVHSEISTMSLFPLFAAKRAGVPVRISHNHATANIVEGKKAVLKRLIRPLSHLFATHFFACGEKAGRWMYGDSLFDNGRVTVMPNAIDAEKFAFSAAARDKLRFELGIPENAFVLGHVGRFIPEKNHAFLLKVFECIAERTPDAYLLLVGEGELTKEIKDLASKSLCSNRIIFAGSRDDAFSVYSAMDVFCLPSFCEGLPLVLPEAQANGIRCVCSDAVTAEADVSGTTCFLSLSASASVWADALIEAAESRGKAVSIPPKWKINNAALWLENKYEQMLSGKYCSFYLRNSSEGPACYYRIAQYLPDLGVEYRLNNAYSRRRYRRNFDMPSGIGRKLFQAWLFIVTCFNRTASLNYDLRHKPEKIIIQREIMPKAMPRFIFRKLRALAEHSEIIWDFDDDIFLEHEISKRESTILQESAKKILVTSEYLKGLLRPDARKKAVLLPTTDGFAEPVDIKEKIENRKSVYDKVFKILWLGSFSNLNNLSMVMPALEQAGRKLSETGKNLELTVCCNKPYEYSARDFIIKNINWTRSVSEHELLSAHCGIMPLEDNEYARGKGGFKLIQYMSAGLPVIASSVGFNKEIVKPAFGYLAEPGARQTWSDAVVELAENRAKWLSMSESSRLAYEKEFSYSQNLAVWKEILKS